MQRRMKELYSKTKNYYILSLENGTAIDSGLRGSAARFANHSCSPNAEMQKWYVNGIPRIGLFATDSIPAGSELTYDYNFDWFEGAEMQVCLCGESNCRGFIGRRSRKPETSRVSPKIFSRPVAVETPRAKSITASNKVKKSASIKPIVKLAKIVKRSPGRPRKHKISEDLTEEVVIDAARNSSVSDSLTSRSPSIGTVRRHTRRHIILIDEDDDDYENDDDIEVELTSQRMTESDMGHDSSPVEPDVIEPDEIDLELAEIIGSNQSGDIEILGIEGFTHQHSEESDESEDIEEIIFDDNHDNEDVTPNSTAKDGDDIVLSPPFEIDENEGFSDNQMGDDINTAVEPAIFDNSLVTNDADVSNLMGLQDDAREDKERDVVQSTSAPILEPTISTVDHTTVDVPIVDVPIVPVQPIPRRRGRPKGSKSRKNLPPLESLPLKRVMRSASLLTNSAVELQDTRNSNIQISLTSSTSSTSKSTEIEPSDLAKILSPKEPKTPRKAAALPVVLDTPAQHDKSPTISKHSLSVDTSDVSRTAKPADTVAPVANLINNVPNYTALAEGLPTITKGNKSLSSAEKPHRNNVLVSPIENVEEVISGSLNKNDQISKQHVLPTKAASTSAQSSSLSESRKKATDVSGPSQLKTTVEISSTATKPAARVLKKKTPRRRRSKNTLSEISKHPPSSSDRPKRTKRKEGVLTQSVSDTPAVAVQEDSSTPVHVTQARPVVSISGVLSDERNHGSQNSVSAVSLPERAPELPQMASRPRLVRLSPSFPKTSSNHHDENAQIAASSNQSMPEEYSTHDHHVLPSPAQTSYGNTHSAPMQVRSFHDQLAPPQHRPHVPNITQSTEGTYLPYGSAGSARDTHSHSQDGPSHYYSAPPLHSMHGTSSILQPQHMQTGPFPSLADALSSNSHYRPPPPSNQHFAQPHSRYLHPQHSLMSNSTPSSSFQPPPYQNSHTYSNGYSPHQPPFPTPLPSIQAHSLPPTSYVPPPPPPPPPPPSGYQSQYGLSPTPHYEMRDGYDRRQFSPPSQSVGPDSGMAPRLPDLLNSPEPGSNSQSMVSGNYDNQPRRQSVYQGPREIEGRMYSENQNNSAGNLITDPHKYRLQRRESAGNTSWRQQVSIQSLVTSDSSSQLQHGVDHLSNFSQVPQLYEPVNTPSVALPERSSTRVNSISSLVNPTGSSPYKDIESSSQSNYTHTQSDSTLETGNATLLSTPTPNRSVSSTSNSLTSLNPSKLPALAPSPTDSSRPLNPAPLAPKTYPPTVAVSKSRRVAGSKGTTLTKPKRGRPPNSARLSFSSPQAIAPLTSVQPIAPLVSATPVVSVPSGQILTSSSSPLSDSPSTLSPGAGRQKKKGRASKNSPTAATKPRRGRPPNSAPAHRPYLAPLALRPAALQEISPRVIAPQSVQSRPLSLRSLPPQSTASPVSRNLAAQESTPLTVAERSKSGKKVSTPTSKKAGTDFNTNSRVPISVEASPRSIAPKPVDTSRKRVRPLESPTSSLAAKRPRTLPIILPNTFTNTNSEVFSSKPINDFVSRASIGEQGGISREPSTPTTGRHSSSPRLTVTNAIKAAGGSNRSSLSRTPKAVSSPGTPGESQKRGRGRPRTRPKDYWTYNNRKARGELGPGSKGPTSSPTSAFSVQNQPNNNSRSSGPSASTTQIEIQPSTRKIQIE